MPPRSRRALGDLSRMRRTPGGASASRLVPHPWPSAWCSPRPGLAQAQTRTRPRIAPLVAEVANVNQKLQDLGAAIQAQQEGVNKAIVDVQTARDNAAAAQQERRRQRASASRMPTPRSPRRRSGSTRSPPRRMSTARRRSYLTASRPRGHPRTAAAGQTLAISSQQVMADLQRARTEQVNKESAARLAKQNADQAVLDAQSSQDDRGRGADPRAADLRRSRPSSTGSPPNALRHRRSSTRRGLVGARGRARPPRRPPRRAHRRAPRRDWDRAPHARADPARQLGHRLGSDAARDP